jgi:hypothetical protein
VNASRCRLLNPTAAVIGLLAAGFASSAPAQTKVDRPERTDRATKAERRERAERDRGGELRAASPGNAPAAVPASRVAASSVEFEPFRIVVERNIFNPNRTGRSASVDEAAAPKVDQIALVGTMESEHGRQAFFAGSEAAFQKTVRVGDTIGDFTVKAIDGHGVELATGASTLPLRVNQQLRRVEAGEWRVIGRDFSPAEPARAELASPAPAPSGPASDVVRRLMEQRRKQLKQ